MNIVGISYSMHESAACIVQDGELLFACAEERLSRQKQDGRFPIRSIKACLEYAGLTSDQVDHVAIGWDRPGKTALHNLKNMLLGRFPTSLTHIQRTVVGMAKELWHAGGKSDYYNNFAPPKAGFHFVGHHEAHALSATALSGFDESAVLVIDGRGASEGTTLWHYHDGCLKHIDTFEYPNSLGVFYAGITEMLGFQPLSDEWKVMGLASYGKPSINLSQLIDITSDNYKVAGKCFFGRNDQDRKSLEKIVGPRRTSEDIRERDFDLARSAQDMCEQAMLALLRRVTKKTNSRRLCLAGGVALNCKANGELLRSGLIDEIYVQPAAGDDGACIGAAYGVYQRLGMALKSHKIDHSYLGTEYSNSDIEKVLKVYKLNYERVDNPSKKAAELLNKGALLGWFQGRMEFGPRALGNRSILSDPRFVENRDKVNDAVKFRENWRPFAPSVMEERGHLYFRDFVKSPYMILSFWATEQARRDIPAVVHVDGSCRVQSVNVFQNPKYYELLVEFEKLSGVGVVMNTSFNLKGDAIVESPKDAVSTFYTSGLDNLVIGDFIVRKS